MKHLDGRASLVVSAPLATCFSLLEAVDGYPSWCDFVREVASVERDREGRPLRAHAVVHVPQSPFAKNFEFDIGIRTEPPRAVHLTRLPSTSSDVERFSLCWSLHDVGGTSIRLEFSASVSFLPGFLPLPGVGEMIAGSLLDAAARRLGGATTADARAPSSR